MRIGLTGMCLVGAMLSAAVISYAQSLNKNHETTTDDAGAKDVILKWMSGTDPFACDFSWGQLPDVEDDVRRTVVVRGRYEFLGHGIIFVDARNGEDLNRVDNDSGDSDSAKIKETRVQFYSNQERIVVSQKQDTGTSTPRLSIVKRDDCRMMIEDDGNIVWVRPELLAATGDSGAGDFTRSSLIQLSAFVHDPRVVLRLANEMRPISIDQSPKSRRGSERGDEGSRTAGAQSYSIGLPDRVKTMFGDPALAPYEIHVIVNSDHSIELVEFFMKSATNDPPDLDEEEDADEYMRLSNFVKPTRVSVPEEVRRLFEVPNNSK